MALPSSGPISLAQIQREFPGVNPISLTEYYRRQTNFQNVGTVRTVAANIKVPLSGSISLSNFYGTRNVIFGCTDSGASNYNASATDTDGSCSYPDPGPTTQTYTLIKLYRFVNDKTGDHHCRTFNYSGIAPDYRPEGELCEIFRPHPQPPDTNGIYDVEPGKPASGLMGHAYLGPDNPIATVPIYELVSANDTMWSKNPNEGSELGYVNRKVAFYAPLEELTVNLN
jgi:hypothetical protein